MEEKRASTMRGEMFVAFMRGLVPSEADYIEREVAAIEDAAKAQERERLRDLVRAHHETHESEILRLLADPED